MSPSRAMALTSLFAGFADFGEVGTHAWSDKVKNLQSIEEFIPNNFNINALGIVPC